MLLAKAGYIDDVDGVKRPTPRGMEIGINAILKQYRDGSYIQCQYGKEAQMICAALALDDLNKQG